MILWQMATDIYIYIWMDRQVDWRTGGLAGDMLINSHRFYRHDKVRH